MNIILKSSKWTEQPLKFRVKKMLQPVHEIVALIS